MITNSKYVFFWAGEFSNWHNAKIEYKGEKFANTEQAYMWEKALHFDDYEIAELILNEPNPKENKKLGRQVKGFNAAEWLNVSFDLMLEINRAKYSQHESLKWQLINTGDRLLVEASPFDEIWGIGLTAAEAVNTPEEEWPGMNLLGKCLTKLRGEI